LGSGQSCYHTSLRLPAPAVENAVNEGKVPPPPDEGLRGEAADAQVMDEASHVDREMFDRWLGLRARTPAQVVANDDDKAPPRDPQLAADDDKMPPLETPIDDEYVVLLDEQAFMTTETFNSVVPRLLPQIQAGLNLPRVPVNDRKPAFVLVDCQSRLSVMADIDDFVVLPKTKKPSGAQKRKARRARCAAAAAATAETNVN
jgi:hypothetical protein